MERDSRWFTTPLAVRAVQGQYQSNHVPEETVVRFETYLVLNSLNTTHHDILQHHNSVTLEGLCEAAW